MKWEMAENSSNSKKPKEKLDKRILIIFLIIFTEILGFSIVLPVLPCALRTGCVEKVEFLKGLIFALYEGLHLLNPFSHVPIGSLEHLGEKSSRDGCHICAGDVLGDLDIHVGAPE